MASEKSLYDMLVMHQGFLEQVKNGFDSDFRKRIPKLSREIKRLFSELNVSNVGDLTKRELTKFTRSVDRANARFFNTYLKELQRDLQEFARENRALEVLIVGNDLDEYGTEVITEETEAESAIRSRRRDDEEDRTYPMTWLFGDNDEALFEYLMSQPMGATGINPNDELAGLKTITGTAMIAAINRAWMNNASKQDALNSILGTEENNLKDGLLLKIERNNSAIVRTIMQSIAVEIEAAIQSLVWSKYQWVSVMDSKTSEICRYLNGRIFEYGKGPVPPKHVHCRSKIVPLRDGVPSKPETFLAWLKRQSREDQIAIVGIKKANLLRDGNTDLDFSKIDQAIKLKPSQLRAKIVTLTR